MYTYNSLYCIYIHIYTFSFVYDIFVYTLVRSMIV